jgi:hypothetical protein
MTSSQLELERTECYVDATSRHHWSNGPVNRDPEQLIVGDVMKLHAHVQKVASAE